ncbi:MAG: DUF1800 family protein [Caulobacteraceae bacterium]|nr:DUF1800 family protein [Caulobacteraceae bacterium]
MSIDRDLSASIAVTRFGLGAKPGEIAAARGDPAGYLRAQIRPAGADQPDGAFESAAQRIADLRQFQAIRREARQAQVQSGVPIDPKADAKDDPVKQARNLIRDDTGEEFLARMRLAATTDAGFRERWALFWFNHFTVSAVKLQTAVVVGPFEREAIRPRVFDRFENLLVASTMHPAMLLYLDQAQSVGPDSRVAGMGRAGAQGPKRLNGLNENLAREVMELHTLGVGSGYTQADVTEFARALTGWSIVGPNEHPYAAGKTPGEFVFRPGFHEPGARRILGKTYAEGGIEQAHAVLTDLARHPATARHIAVKLARHFVADDPPPALTARLEASFNASGGRLDALAATLIDSPEAWDPRQRKFKTPYEFLVSGYRAAGLAPGELKQVAPVLTGLGQKPFSAPSPKGWDETAGDWAAPDGIVKRMSWSEAFAQATAPVAGQPLELARNTLGARLSPAVATAIAHAESRPEAFSILLMSPEFQRR